MSPDKNRVITLAGTLCGLGALGEDGLASLTPDTPRILFQMPDGSAVHLVGITVDQVKSMAPHFYEPVRVIVESANASNDEPPSTSAHQINNELPPAAPSSLAATGWCPQFDVMSPRQEELAIQFCQEIAGRRGETGRAPDPVRLLEMAQALYDAERDHAANQQVLQVERKPAGGAGP